MPDNNKRYKLFGDVVRLISQTPSMTTYKTSNGFVQKISTRTFREKAVFVPAGQSSDSNFTVSVLNELELAKKAEVKELAYRRLDKARNKIDEAAAVNYLPNEVSRMNERLKQVTTFINGKFMKTKDSKTKDSDYTYKIKCGADMKEVTVKAGTEEEAKKKVVEIAKNLKYKGKQIKTKWDK